jgi:hypothetical protein
MVTLPQATVGAKQEAPKGAAPQGQKEESPGGSVENEEVWGDLRTGETPPPAAVGE